jgi:hypothetical protein
MSENTAAVVTETEIVESVEDTELTLPTLEEIVDEIVTESEEQTAYRVAVAVNQVFEAVGSEKRVPTQMMYNYTRNGMIVKGKKGSAKEIRYTRTEVLEYVTKFTAKYVK